MKESRAKEAARWNVLVPRRGHEEQVNTPNRGRVKGGSRHIRVLRRA